MRKKTKRKARLACNPIRVYHEGVTYEARPNDAGIWYVHWSENRRTIRRSTGTRERSEALAFVEEFTHHAKRPETSVPTCEALYRMKYPEGETERADIAWKALGPVFGHLLLTEVTREREAAYKKKRGVAKSTLRTELSMLRASWNSAVRQNIVSADDVPLLDPLPPASAPRDRVLTREEVAKLFEGAKHHERVHRFLWLALQTGARRTAIQELTWRQVDWDSGVVHYLPEGAVQSSKRRASVPISAALRPILQAAYEARASDDEPVIGPGARINEQLDRVAAQAGVSGVTPHVLRHTAATFMARNGVPLWIIAKVLGNTLEQVENVYAKYQPGMAQAAVDGIMEGVL